MSAENLQETDSTGVVALSKANNHLAVNLYKLLSKERENLFFSPFSLSAALGMLFCGTGSQTASEMRATLGYNSAQIGDKDLKSCFKILLAELEKCPESYTLSCANSMVSHKHFAIKPHYKSLLEVSFKALLKEVDFERESAEAVQQINAWVKNNTNDMIPQLLDSLDPTTVIVLLNAVYFKGTWMHQFKAADTFLQYFYTNGLEDEYKQVEMMHLKESFPFVQKESFKALQLPYKGKDIAMLILLPNSKNGIEDLEGQLSPDFIQGLKQEMHSSEVEVALPKFKLEYSKSLAGHFKKLGMISAFAPGADFCEMSDSKNLYVSEIVHKAVLEVNEEGSEAAAATAVVMMLSMISLTPEFIVEHPFMFLIYNTQTDLILFMGRVNEL